MAPEASTGPQAGQQGNIGVSIRNCLSQGAKFWQEGDLNKPLTNFNEIATVAKQHKRLVMELPNNLDYDSMR